MGYPECHYAADLSDECAWPFGFVALLLPLCKAVQAGQITYVETVTGSGTLGSDTFSNALITLTLVGDPANLHLNSSFDTLVNSTNIIGTVAVPGIGTATFTDSPEAFTDFSDFAGVDDFTVHSPRC